LVKNLRRYRCAMNKVKKTGQKIDKIRQESNLNVRRVTENFPQPHRTIDSINQIHPYQTEFTMTEGSSARLTFKVTEFPTPCTVNPPILHISTGSYFNGDSPGYITELISPTNLIDPPNPDFVLVDGGIQVPLDGCYSVFWTSGAWGVGYFSDKVVTVSILRERDGNLYSVRLVTQGPTGVTALLGPLIYSYVPASPVYAVVECNAGDRIRVAMTQNDIGEPYPWWGVGLPGFFDVPLNGSNVTVTLVAVAEK
jgi:hypothetical protein